jgi:hypothetical protein
LPERASTKFGQQIPGLLQPARRSESVNRFHRLALFVLFSAAWLRPAGGATESLEQTIDYLFHYIAESHAVFIRNGSEHTPQEAVDHIRDKYQYYREKIKTPEDFIRLAASKSMLSGQPYLVRPPGEKERRLDQWLREALLAHRQMLAASHASGR